MISLVVVITFILTHFIADFLCQTDWMAQNKSKSNEALLQHTLVYSAIWIAPIILLGVLTGYSENMVWFIPITFLCHTITDYITSRINTKLWNAKEVHWFFVSIGFDQVLHYVQLFLTYWILK